MWRRTFNYFYIDKSKNSFEKINGMSIIKLQKELEKLEDLEHLEDLKNNVYKNFFNPFLCEGTMKDNPLFVLERNNPVNQFYFREFLLYQAGLTSDFWCSRFGKKLLKQLEYEEQETNGGIIENKNYYYELSNYQYIIYNVYGDINISDLLNICDDLACYFYIESI